MESSEDESAQAQSAEHARAAASMTLSPPPPVLHDGRDNHDGGDDDDDGVGAWHDERAMADVRHEPQSISATLLTTQPPAATGAGAGVSAGAAGAAGAGAETMSMPTSPTSPITPVLTSPVVVSAVPSSQARTPGWRKYGQKTIRNFPHPVSYYRCTMPNCTARKRVVGDGPTANVFIISDHNHASVEASPSSSAGGSAGHRARKGASEHAQRGSPAARTSISPATGAAAASAPSSGAAAAAAAAPAPSPSPAAAAAAPAPSPSPAAPAKSSPTKSSPLKPKQRQQAAAAAAAPQPALDPQEQREQQQQQLLQQAQHFQQQHQLLHLQEQLHQHQQLQLQLQQFPFSQPAALSAAASRLGNAAAQSMVDAYNRGLGGAGAEFAGASVTPQHVRGSPAGTGNGAGTGTGTPLVATPETGMASPSGGAIVPQRARRGRPARNHTTPAGGPGGPFTPTVRMPSLPTIEEGRVLSTPALPASTFAANAGASGLRSGSARRTASASGGGSSNNGGGSSGSSGRSQAGGLTPLDLLSTTAVSPQYPDTSGFMLAPLVGSAGSSTQTTFGGRWTSPQESPYTPAVPSSRAPSAGTSSSGDRSWASISMRMSPNDVFPAWNSTDMLMPQFPGGQSAWFADATPLPLAGGANVDLAGIAGTPTAAVHGGSAQARSTPLTAMQHPGFGGAVGSGQAAGPFFGVATVQGFGASGLGVVGTGLGQGSDGLELPSDHEPMSTA